MVRYHAASAWMRYLHLRPDHIILRDGSAAALTKLSGIFPLRFPENVLRTGFVFTSSLHTGLVVRDTTQ